ncbi:baseplate hub domain-containing protein [Shewanella sp. SE1]|uniref:baseplate hub domain-containing protein n=1 Tax=Shewanella sp. SE1 TaxID=2705014 RepID=UPI00138EF9A3|nr:DUF2163 domain-containing protein [Shewanella sp. SE1]NDO73082.1 DUF2163 domain-containing protein [Shewanella sp. SE1]
MIAICVLILTNDRTTIALTNAPYDVNVAGKSYQSVGEILEISEAKNTQELATQGVTISLNGLSTINDIVGRDALLNAPIDILIADIPDGSDSTNNFSYYHRGYCGEVQFAVENNGYVASVETQSVFKQLDKKASLMETNTATHQTQHSGDLFYQYAVEAGLGTNEETWKS